jgi:hypothetical protein
MTVETRFGVAESPIEVIVYGQRSLFKAPFAMVYDVAR